MLKHIKNIESHSCDGISHLWFTPIDQYYTREDYGDIQVGLSDTLPLHLLWVNDEHCFDKYYRRRKASEVFAVELILKGSMYFIQNKKKYRAKPGSVVLIHRDQDNEFATGPEKYCHRLACVWDGQELNSLLHVTKLIEHDVIKLNNQPTIERTMRECFDELKAKKTGFRRRASILGYRLLLELEENLEHKQIPGLLLQAINLMNGHLSQPLSLKKMAEILKITPISLNRMFQRHFNCSPVNYFINLKLEAAKSFLRNTNMQIQEIAENIGYSSAVYFTAEFKKRTGISPREFRKQSGNGHQII